MTPTCQLSNGRNSAIQKLRLIDVGHGHVNLSLRELALVLLRFPVLPIKNSLSILIHLDLGDDHVAWVDSDGDRHLVCLLLSAAFDVDDVFLSVAREDLTITLEVSTNDLDFVTLAQWQRANIVLLTELRAQSSRHDNTTHGRGGGEMGLAALAPRRRNRT